MPSPFPGMNPYLERQSEWDSFHTLFIGEVVKFLAAKLKSKYLVRSGVRLYVHEPTAKERRFFAQSELSLAEKQRPKSAKYANKLTVAAPKYRTIPKSAVTEKIRNVEIRDKENRSLVTTIELLSRTNKIPKEDRELFLNKRDELLRSNSHYVEINLLRAGRPLPFNPPIVGPYYVAVCRAEDEDRVGTWEWSLRNPIPLIPVPLLKPDPDITLNIKTLLDNIYDECGLEDSIYDLPPDPPLSPKDNAWAKSLISS